MWKDCCKADVFVRISLDFLMLFVTKLIFPLRQISIESERANEGEREGFFNSESNR